MTLYGDGEYYTHPTHGPSTAIRIVTINNQIVYVKNPETGELVGFTQYDFFKVNTMVGEVNGCDD